MNLHKNDFASLIDQDDDNLIQILAKSVSLALGK